MGTVFDRVVCGVDASDAGTEAARQATRVTEPEGSLTLVTVDDPSIAVHAGWRMAAIAEELAIEARDAVGKGRAAAETLHPVATRLLEGNPLHCLLAEIERQNATLVVVGSHGYRRATGIALGSVATHLLHESPCSVLIARAPRDPARWPRSIVVGVDGSLESAAAADVARGLGERFGASVRFVAAKHGHVDLEAARAIAPELEELAAHPLDELHVLSELADLVVVGSRGLKGVRALGSVSERTAHDARCSVLVVRTRKSNPGGESA
jgi:nucleotide-binding universal stress UspA family protein